jgi:hypothetical protein
VENKLVKKENKIKKYHEEKVESSLENFDSKAKIILHLIPLEKKHIKPTSIQKLADSDLPFNTIYFTRKMSPPIMLPHNQPTQYIRCGNSGNSTYASYLILRNCGCIESIDAQLLSGNDGIIPTILLKERLTERIVEYCNILEFLQVKPPIFIYLTLKDINGKKLPNSYGKTKSPIKKNIIHNWTKIESYKFDITLIDALLSEIITDLSQ